MTFKCFIGECLRPLILCLPFGRVRVLALFGARDQDDVSWTTLKHPTRVFYDRRISAYIAVTLTEWGGRWHYFTGRYYDTINPLLIHKLLKRGDTYIDIGANLGVHTMAASRVVGDTGMVMAVEPNPHTFAHLQAHLTINRITNVRAFNVGLSDANGELELKGTSEHTGKYTFRDVSDCMYSVKVPVLPGDQLIDKALIRRRVLVKIDVEGFEHRVVRGLTELMTYPDIGFVVEVTDQWLRETGSSAAELYAEFQKHGFKPYLVSLHYSWFLPVLEIRHLETAPEGQCDILFVHPGYLGPNSL